MTQIVRYPVGTTLEIYNNATVNYERVQAYWTGNTFIIRSDAAGTGTRRGMQINAHGGGLIFNQFANASGSIQMKVDTPTAGVGIAGVTGALSGSSTSQFALKIAPTLAQTATAGYTALLVNVTETTVGSGAKRLIDAQVGSASKFSVDNAGVTFLANAAVEPATPTGGGVIFVAGGALKFKGSSGTVTVLAPA
jgi:hypothetical protein